MTNQPIPSYAELAAAALPYFDDINSHTTLLAYCDDLAATDSDDLRDRLISALDNDIADLLHNANLFDLYPAAEHYETDADADALLDFMLEHDDYIPMIADALLERYPA